MNTDWFKIGIEYNAFEEQRTALQAKIDAMQWFTPSQLIKSQPNVAFLAKDIIVGFLLPKVSHIAQSGMFLGIRAHYIGKQVDIIFAVEDANKLHNVIIPICANTIDKIPIDKKIAAC